MLSEFTLLFFFFTLLCVCGAGSGNIHCSPNSTIVFRQQKHARYEVGSPRYLHGGTSSELLVMTSPRYGEDRPQGRRTTIRGNRFFPGQQRPTFFDLPSVVRAEKYRQAAWLVNSPQGKVVTEPIAG